MGLFILGMFSGAVVGVILMCLLAMASQADDSMEEEYKKFKNK